MTQGCEHYKSSCWGDGAGAKVLPLQEGGLEFNPQNSCKRNRRVMAHAWHPRAGEAERGRLLALNRPDSLNCGKFQAGVKP